MTQNSSTEPCPVCSATSTISPRTARDIPYFDHVACPRCGSYLVVDKNDLKNALTVDAQQIKTYATHVYQRSRSLENFYVALGKCAYLSKTKTNTNECRAIISHVLSRAPVDRPLTFDDFTNILTYTVLPSPAEQADILIKYLGDKLSGLGDTFAIGKESDELKKSWRAAWK
jgi:Zn-finger nucleic acid-binding protein